MSKFNRNDGVKAVKSAMDQLEKDIKTCDLGNVIGMAEYLGMGMGAHAEMFGDKGEADMYKLKGRLDDLNFKLVESCKLVRK